MIKADVSKNNKSQVIHAEGSVPELANDIAVLFNGIYTQLLCADPDGAEMFRVMVQGMVRDSGGPCWKPMDGQTGIIFHKTE